MAKVAEPKLCIWCITGEIEHGFEIPLCVPCLVKIHHMTTDQHFDSNKILQDYLKEKRGKVAKPGKKEYTDPQKKE